MNKIFLLFIIILAVLTRVAPHPPNFLPIFSIALFSGVCFRSKFSFLIPLSIMILSDLYIGNFQMALWVYPSLFAIYIIGFIFVKKVNYLNILTYSMISAFLFFLITNFGVWIVGYPKTFNGFVTCFTLAVPFFKNTLFASLFYSSILYFIYDYVLRGDLVHTDK